MTYILERLFGPTAGPKADIDDDERLRIARHHRLCTAIPFPALNWQEQDVEKSLARLHDYAVQIANSSIDWYLQRKRAKKFFARTLHSLTFLFGILAAIIPVLKMFSTELQSQLMRLLFAGLVTNPSAFAAETALVLIAIAGGFALIDRAAGFSADWMRYLTTAERIN